MNSLPKSDVSAIVLDGTAIDQAIVAAGHKVIERHRMLGMPLVIWRDGRVVEVPAETVDLEPEQDPDGVAMRVAERTSD